MEKEQGGEGFLAVSSGNSARELSKCLSQNIIRSQILESSQPTKANDMEGLF